MAWAILQLPNLAHRLATAKGSQALDLWTEVAATPQSRLLRRRRLLELSVVLSMPSRFHCPRPAPCGGDTDDSPYGWTARQLVFPGG